MRIMQRTAVGLAMVALLSGTAAAQDMATSLDELSGSGRLQAGDGVHVTDARGRRIKGDVVDLSSVAVSLTDGRTTWTVADAEISRIGRADPLKNGMWIGAGLAFAGAIANCHLVEKRRSGYCYATFYTLPISLGLGVGLGALFDANRREKLFEATGSADVQVSPVVTQGGAGARLSVGW